MGIKISEMTPDTAVGGAELIPVSDAGSPKSITPSGIAGYIIDQIEAIAAGTAVATGNGLFALQSGVLKPVDIDLVCQRAIDTVWGKAAEATPLDACIVPLKNGSTEKTITLTVLAEYVRAEIEAAILDVSGLADGSSSLASTDYITVTQGTTAKRIQVSDLTTLIYAGLAATVTALGAVTTPADADVLYVLQGGVAKKVTLTQIATYIGATITGSGTADALAQWVDADTLKAGPTITASTAGFGAGSDTSIPTTKAVRDELDAIISDHADIDANLADADTILVDDGGAGTQRKSAVTRVWTYAWSKITAAAAKTTPVDADGIGIVDSVAPTVVKLLTFANMWTNYLLGKATAIKLDDFTAPDDNTDLNASTSKHGLLVKATAPASGLLSVVGIGNGETAYTNKALFDTTNPAALGAVGPGTQVIAARRDHVHANPALDTLASPTDIATLNASTSAHGLSPKATAPAAGLRNVLGIDNGETAHADKALFDATTPAAVGTGAVGSAMTAARRDHVHDALPFAAVDGTLATGANADFSPVKLVYNKTCSDSDGDDVIDLHDGTVIGQVLTVYLGTKGGSDNAIITPVTKLGYSTITLDAANELATLQWQGATVGWAILYTTGTVA